MGEQEIKSVFFLSDAHLGAETAIPSRRRERRLVRWLHQVAPQADAIVFVGDILDFWYEWKHAVPQGFVRLLGAIAYWTDQGLPIYWIVGNHDQWIFDYLPREIGVRVIEGPWQVQWQGKTFYIDHGHHVPPHSLGERFTNALFESRLARHLFRLVHPDLGIAIARKWSHTSRMNHHRVPPPEALAKYERFVAQMEKQCHYDFYLFGHLHYPVQKQIGQAKYINLGDWLEHFTYAHFDGKDVKLLQWDDTSV